LICSTFNNVNLTKLKLLPGILCFVGSVFLISKEKGENSGN
jgi:hypothetical protein